MELETGLEIFIIVRMATTIALLVIYLLALYWNVLFLVKTKWQIYSYLKLYTAIACLAMVLVYGYMGVRLFFGTPVEVTVLGTLIVRPAIILIGGSIAASARARYTTLKSGGEIWILRV